MLDSVELQVPAPHHCTCRNLSGGRSCQARLWQSLCVQASRGIHPMDQKSDAVHPKGLQHIILSRLHLQCQRRANQVRWHSVVKAPSIHGIRTLVCVSREVFLKAWKRTYEGCCRETVVL